MALTVSNRIAGGFLVVVSLLVVISTVSISNVRGINSDLLNIVDQANPMLKTSGDLISTMLQANDRVNRFKKQNQLDQLSAYQSEYSSFA